MAKYQKPVLLLNKTENGWEGSGRNCGNSKLENLREFLNDTGYVSYAEGHASAFGVGLTDNNSIDNLINKADILLKDCDFSPCYKVDFIFDTNDTKLPDVVQTIANFDNLWGQNVEEPLIAIENIRISKNNITLMSKDKNPTLKITMPNNDISIIKFKSSQEEYDSLVSNEYGYITINIVGRCASNQWNNNTTY